MLGSGEVGPGLQHSIQELPADNGGGPNIMIQLHGGESSQH